MLSVIITQLLSALIIIVNYEIHKDYITQNFCENKNKPQMHCNGKCHLKKQLQKQEKNENAPVNPIKAKTEMQLFCQKMNFSFITPVKEKHTYSFYLQKKITPPLSSIFHPPKSLA